MDFHILGPLQVVDDGRAVSLSPKQQALVAMLLLHRGEVVPAEWLIESLYRGHPPRSAAKSLQAHVSRLRKALGKGCSLRTEAGGYVLDVERGALDLDRFEDLVERGRRELTSGEANLATNTLGEALALWRGTPLTDFRYEDFAQGQIARLEEIRLAVEEDRIEAELALGRHGDLVGELERVVAENPLRERLRGQLMTALYRCGRQAEALEVYTESRRLLTEELGLEPGEELKRLQGAILARDPSLAPPRRVEAAIAREEGPAERIAAAFLGRAAELRELQAGLEHAMAGRGRLFLISGEPGIGKSRLLEELAGHARTRGARVLVGRSWEAGGAPAYWPWVQALRSYMQSLDVATMRSQLVTGAADLAQMLPELRELLPDLPEPPAMDPETARFRLFDAVSSLLVNASKAQPLVVILDDLHAADAPSLLLLRFLALALANGRLLVAGAYRDVDPTPGDALSEAVAELRRERATRALPLTGLPESDVARFIELASAHAPAADLAAAVHTETEGNPLFIGEIVRLLAAEGRLEDPLAARELTVPGSIKEIIGRRLGRLPDECGQILALAAVLGREFELRALELLNQMSRDELLDLLDDAIAARVIGEMPGTPGRLRFSHVLIRETLYDDLSAARRLRLHRQAGEGLESLYAADPEAHLAELAHHFFAAAPAGLVDKAVDYARRAGARAVGLLAYEEAVRLYGLALRALELESTVDEKLRCELLLALGDAQARAGDEANAKGTFLEAAALARALDAPEQLARAAHGYGGRFVWARAGTDAHIVPLLEGAVAALGKEDSALRVRVMTRLAGALRDQHDREPRAALSQEAVEIARRLGDPATLGYALEGRWVAIFWPENAEDRVEIAEELVRLAESIHDSERAALAHYYRAMAGLELGNMATVHDGLERYAQLTEELREPAHSWLLVVTQATVALFQGRFEEGERLMDEALALGEGAQRSDAVLSYRIQRFTLARERGGLEEIEETIQRSMEEYPARPMFRCMLASLYTDLGREREAREVFESLAAGRFGKLPVTNEWLFSLGFLAEVASFLGDLERAETLYELLLPYPARNASTADYIATGSVSRYIGVLASTMSRWEDAERHFEDAVAMNGRIRARPSLAHTQEDYARMLLERGRPGDREKHRELLTEALTAYRELGMDAFAANVSRSLRRLPSRAARGRSAPGRPAG